MIEEMFVELEVLKHFEFSKCFHSLLQNRSFLQSVHIISLHINLGDGLLLCWQRPVIFLS